MANATSVTNFVAGAASFRGVVDQLFFAKATMDVGNLIDAAGETNTIAVPGVALGDIVLGVSLAVSVAGITVTAWVSAADTVSVRFQNESGGPLDLASATVRVIVVRPIA
jgi:hypothetical protein